MKKPQSRSKSPASVNINELPPGYVKSPQKQTTQSTSSRPSRPQTRSSQGRYQTGASLSRISVHLNDETDTQKDKLNQLMKYHDFLSHELNAPETEQKEKTKPPPKSKIVYVKAPPPSVTTATKKQSSSSVPQYRPIDHMYHNDKSYSSSDKVHVVSPMPTMPSQRGESVYSVSIVPNNPEMAEVKREDEDENGAVSLSQKSMDSAYGSQEVQVKKEPEDELASRDVTEHFDEIKDEDDETDEFGGSKPVITSVVSLQGLASPSTQKEWFRSPSPMRKKKVAKSPSTAEDETVEDSEEEEEIPMVSDSRNMAQDGFFGMFGLVSKADVKKPDSNANENRSHRDKGGKLRKTIKPRLESDMVYNNFTPTNKGVVERENDVPIQGSPRTVAKFTAAQAEKLKRFEEKQAARFKRHDHELAVDVALGKSLRSPEHKLPLKTAKTKIPKVKTISQPSLNATDFSFDSVEVKEEPEDVEIKEEPVDHDYSDAETGIKPRDRRTKGRKYWGYLRSQKPDLYENDWTTYQAEEQEKVHRKPRNVHGQTKRTQQETKMALEENKNKIEETKQEIQALRTQRKLEDAYFVETKSLKSLMEQGKYRTRLGAVVHRLKTVDAQIREKQLILKALQIKKATLSEKVGHQEDPVHQKSASPQKSSASQIKPTTSKSKPRSSQSKPGPKSKTSRYKVGILSKHKEFSQRKLSTIKSNPRSSPAKSKSSSKDNEYGDYKSYLDSAENQRREQRKKRYQEAKLFLAELTGKQEDMQKAMQQPPSTPPPPPPAPTQTHDNNNKPAQWIMKCKKPKKWQVPKDISVKIYKPEDEVRPSPKNCASPHMCTMCPVNDHSYAINSLMKDPLPKLGGCLHMTQCVHFQCTQHIIHDAPRRGLALEEATRSMYEFQGYDDHGNKIDGTLPPHLMSKTDHLRIKYAKQLDKVADAWDKKKKLKQTTKQARIQAKEDNISEEVSLECNEDMPEEESNWSTKVPEGTQILSDSLSVRVGQLTHSLGVKSLPAKPNVGSFVSEEIIDDPHVRVETQGAEVTVGENDVWYFPITLSSDAYCKTPFKTVRKGRSKEYAVEVEIEGFEDLEVKKLHPKIPEDLYQVTEKATGETLVQIHLQPYEEPAVRKDGKMHNIIKIKAHHMKDDKIPKFQKKLDGKLVLGRNGMVALCPKTSERLVKFPYSYVEFKRAQPVLLGNIIAREALKIIKLPLPVLLTFSFKSGESRLGVALKNDERKGVPEAVDVLMVYVPRKEDEMVINIEELREENVECDDVFDNVADTSEVSVKKASDTSLPEQKPRWTGDPKQDNILKQISVGQYVWCPVTQRIVFVCNNGTRTKVITRSGMFRDLEAGKVFHRYYFCVIHFEFCLFSK